eukprot:6455478-Amphidinium_carterae.3
MCHQRAFDSCSICKLRATTRTVRAFIECSHCERGGSSGRSLDRLLPSFAPFEPVFAPRLLLRNAGKVARGGGAIRATGALRLACDHCCSGSSSGVAGGCRSDGCLLVDVMSSITIRQWRIDESDAENE